MNSSCLAFELIMVRDCPYPGSGQLLRDRGQVPTSIPGSLRAAVHTMNFWGFAHRPLWVADTSVVTVSMSGRATAVNPSEQTSTPR